MTTLYKYIKRGLKQASNKKVRPHEFQEGNFVLLSNQTPGASGCLLWRLMCNTFTTMDSDKLTRPMNAGAVKKYSVKKYELDKSQILKSGLGKNERLGRLKTRKGSLGKN